jgi:hypothetical protein
LSALCGEVGIRWRQIFREGKLGIIKHDHDFQQRRQRYGVGILKLEQIPYGITIVSSAASLMLAPAS